MEELSIIDIQFLDGCSKPTIAVLYQDTKEARHIKTYTVILKDKVRKPELGWQYRSSYFFWYSRGQAAEFWLRDMS